MWATGRTGPVRSAVQMQDIAWEVAHARDLVRALQPPGFQAFVVESDGWIKLFN